MKRVLFVLSALLALALCCSPHGVRAQSQAMSGGDSTLAAGATLKLYPCFSPGGGHIHSSQFVSTANGCDRALRGYVFTSAGDVRVKVYGAATVDTSGFTIPGGSTFGSLPACDSVIVLSTSLISTRITWGFFR